MKRIEFYTTLFALSILLLASGPLSAAGAGEEEAGARKTRLLQELTNAERDDVIARVQGSAKDNRLTTLRFINALHATVESPDISGKNIRGAMKQGQQKGKEGLATRRVEADVLAQKT